MRPETRREFSCWQRSRPTVIAAIRRPEDRGRGPRPRRAGQSRRPASNEPDLRKVRDREIVFTAEALLDPGAYRCRIILRDLESGDAAMAYAAVTIPAATSAGGLKLFSPLLLTSYRPMLAWEGETKKAARRWTDVYPYDPAKYALLADDVPAGTRSIYAVVPYALGKLRRGPVSLRAALDRRRQGNADRDPFNGGCDDAKGRRRNPDRRMRTRGDPRGKIPFIYLRGGSRDAGRFLLPRRP